MTKLRAASPSQQRSYHSSVFKSGIALGLAVPALVSGVYQSTFISLHDDLDILFWTAFWHKGFQLERRAQIPAWDALLFIYGVFMVPVLFSLLIGITMSIWSNSRINYVFIFGPCVVYSFHSTRWPDSIELDVRTRLDYREYFEVDFLVSYPYHILITRSDPCNTPDNAHLRILVFFLSYCQSNYLAARLVGVRVCSYAKPLTYSVQVVAVVACEEYRWATYQWCSSGWGEYELSGRCTSW